MEDPNKKRKAPIELPGVVPGRKKVEDLDKNKKTANKKKAPANHVDIEKWSVGREKWYEYGPHVDSLPTTNKTKDATGRGQEHNRKRRNHSAQVTNKKEQINGGVYILDPT